MKDDLRQRLSRASPAKRALLEELLRKKGISLPDAAESGEQSADGNTMVDVLKRMTVKLATDQGGPGHFRDKEAIQRTYNAYHEQLRGAAFHDHSVFMNLGYVATGAPEHSTVRLPEHMIGRNYVKLVLEVLGDCALDGRRVLDVGCGRGGTINVLNRYFRPSLSVGIDLAAGAIAMCRAQHKYPGAIFLRADAEKLPFAAGAFDVVTNIESSHHYPDIDSFYRGVARVLTAGGHFLYTTLLPNSQFQRDLGLLQDLGFVVEREQDISSNVLASCDHDRRHIFGGIASLGDDTWLANAIGLSGSQLHKQMASGEIAYKLFRLKKSES